MSQRACDSPARAFNSRHVWHVLKKKQPWVCGGCGFLPACADQNDMDESRETANVCNTPVCGFYTRRLLIQTGWLERCRLMSFSCVAWITSYLAAFGASIESQLPAGYSTETVPRKIRYPDNIAAAPELPPYPWSYQSTQYKAAHFRCRLIRFDCLGFTN